MMDFRTAGVVVALGVSVLATGCRAPSEPRPAFTEEKNLPPAALTGTIAFAGEDAGAAVVFAYDLDSKRTTRLTGPEEEERAPAFSPDGRLLATAGLGDQPGIYVRSANGGERRPVVTGNGFFDSPTWSPDGRQIAYAFNLGGPQSDWDVYVVGLDGTDARRLTTKPSQEWGPAWSPDGRTIAYVSDSDGDNAIWTLDVGTGREAKIVDGPEQDAQPAWSPDGSRLAFSSNRELDRWQLFLYEPATGEISRARRTTGVDRFPTWSPDGRLLAASVGYLAVYPAPGESLRDGADRWKLTTTLALASTWRSA